MNIRQPANIPATEVDQSFMQGMADRMAVSYCKYGAVADAYPSKVDAIETLKVRLARYEATGNTEWLQDVANFAMIEYMHPRHPHAHYRPTDSSESPGRVWQDGAVTQRANTHAREVQDFYRRTGD